MPAIGRSQRSRYRTIYVRMWGDEKFRRLSRIPPCGQGLWVYLLTGPHTGPIPGLFRSGPAAIAEQLGWTQKAFDEAFAEVLRQGLAEVDWEVGLVWIPKAVEYNKPQSPNVVLSWANEWDLMPECGLKWQAGESLRTFVYGLGEGYEQAFLQVFGDTLPKPCLKASRNQEQEQEQHQEQQQEQKQEPGVVGVKAPLQPPTKSLSSSRKKRATLDGEVVGGIFAYWQKAMNSPRSKLDAKREKAIRDALAMGYSAHQLCQAIRGCSRTPHNMGENDQHQAYNGIALIFRSADQIDRFIRNDATPPKAHYTDPDERRRAISDANGDAWLAGKQDDPLTIDMEDVDHGNGR